MIAYETACGKEHNGILCEFGEPVFGYAKSSAKTFAKVSAKSGKRMIFLGKTEPQDSYLLYDGEALVLTRNIRRAGWPWKSHLPFYLNFDCWSWNYKSTLGGRAISAKTKRSAVAASFDAPQSVVEPLRFFDEEAEFRISEAEFFEGTEGKRGNIGNVNA